MHHFILPLFSTILLSTVAYAHEGHFVNSSAAVDPQNGFTVPQLGSGVGLLDQQNERAVGEMVYREVQRELPVLQDLWLEDQMNQVFSELLSPSQVQEPIGLILINDANVNAFAVPGGLFALNTGIITTAQNMDEVAAVVAHEIAHVSQRHYRRSQDAFKNQSLLSIAGLIVGAAIAAKASPDAGSAVMLGSQAALLDQQLRYSRNQEREADRIGMQYMAAAGYNPMAMADFFERMYRSSIRMSFLPDFWLTHPLTSERISESRLRAGQYPKVKNRDVNHPFAPNFALIRTYTAMRSGLANEANLLNLAQQGNAAAQLSLAALYSQHAAFDKAQAMLNMSRAQLSQEILYTLIQTDVFLGLQQLPQAYASIIKIQQIMPENRALSLKLAEVYIAQKQANAALQLLRVFSEQNPRDITVWAMMQQAMSLKKDDPHQAIQVLRYRAEQQFWSGKEIAAIRSLLQAQRLAKDNPVLLSAVNQRLAIMQEARKSGAS